MADTGPEANYEAGEEMRLTPRLQFLIVAVVSVFALSLFSWPLIAPVGPEFSRTAAPTLALSLLPLLVVVLGLLLEGSISGPKQLAMLATLSALAAATRIATSGVGGFELVFVIVILGGRAFGMRFGFLLGLLSIASSSLFFGGIGPWTAFQMIAVGWVGAVAGLRFTRKTLSRRREVFGVAFYALLASYLFGLLMNLWFWPFAIGPETSISYSPDASFTENFGSFLFYSLATSTLTWDTVRAISTAVVILAIGQPILSVLKRAKI